MNAMAIGIDLRDRRSHVCVLGPDGMIVGRENVASTRAGLWAFLERFAGARVTMEVGGHSRWAGALAQELGHEVIVARIAFPSGALGDPRPLERLGKLGTEEARRGSSSRKPGQRISPRQTHDIVKTPAT